MAVNCYIKDAQNEMQENIRNGKGLQKRLGFIDKHRCVLKGARDAVNNIHRKNWLWLKSFYVLHLASDLLYTCPLSKFHASYASRSLAAFDCSAGVRFVTRFMCSRISFLYFAETRECPISIVTGDYDQRDTVLLSALLTCYHHPVAEFEVDKNQGAGRVELHLHLFTQVIYIYTTLYNIHTVDVKGVPGRGDINIVIVVVAHCIRLRSLGDLLLS